MVAEVNLTNAEAARFLRCSIETLNDRRRAGEFKEGRHFKQVAGPRSGNGRRTYLWFKDALDDYLRSTQPAVEDSPIVPLKQSSLGGVA